MRLINLIILLSLISCVKKPTNVESIESPKPDLSLLSDCDFMVQEDLQKAFVYKRADMMKSPHNVYRVCKLLFNSEDETIKPAVIQNEKNKIYFQKKTSEQSK